MEAVSRVVTEPAREYKEPRDSEPRDEPERGDRGDRGDLASDDAVLADLLAVDEQYAPLLALVTCYTVFTIFFYLSLCGVDATRKAHH